jgi:hypothetical protein
MRRQIFAMALATFAPCGALLAAGLDGAGGIHHDYVQADLLRTEMSASGSSPNGDGYAFEGSWEFSKPFTAYGSIASDKVSRSGFGIEVKPLTLGVGMHRPLGKLNQFVGLVSFERARIKAFVPGDSATDTYNGFGISAGIRGQYDVFEWTGELKYRDLGDLKSDIGIVIGGKYFFMPWLAAGVDLSTRKYDNGLGHFREQVASFNLRYTFVRD